MRAVGGSLLDRPDLSVATCRWEAQIKVRGVLDAHGRIPDGAGAGEVSAVTVGRCRARRTPAPGPAICPAERPMRPWAPKVGHPRKNPGPEPKFHARG